MTEGKSRPLALHWQVLIAVGLAAVAGWWLPRVLGPNVIKWFDFFGQLFLRLLQMLVVPLIASAVVSAVARIGKDGALGRLGLKTISYYVATTLLAILISLTVMNSLRPGAVSAEVSQHMIDSTKSDAEEVTRKVEGRSSSDIIDVVLRMIPVNIFAAASSNSEMLAIIFFSLLFGFFITQLPAERQQRVSLWWEDAYEVMLRITDWAIRFTPYGVFALVAATVAKTGFDALGPLAKFFFCVLLALALHMFVALPLLMKFFRLSPARHFRAVAPALLTAFSTASSSATLPVTMECVEKKAGVSRRIAGLTLPLGATVNMDGTAIYECAVVLFIAQIFGAELTLATQATIVILALLTSIGVAGIPAASLVAIVIILNAVGLPQEAIGMVLAVDRLLDMSRTTVNVFGDTCGAVIVARSEGEAVLTP